MFSSFFVEDSNPDNFKVFSYYGVVATFIALIITIFEISYSISISSSLKDKVELELSNHRNLELNWDASRCVEMVETMKDYLSREKYTEVKMVGREVRKLVRKHYPELSTRHYGVVDLKNITLVSLIEGMERYESIPSSTEVSTQQIRKYNSALSELINDIENNYRKE